MADDVNLKGLQSNKDSSTSPTLSNQIGWVTFDEQDNKESKCNNCIAEEKVSARNGQYISRLGGSSHVKNVVLIIETKTPTQGFGFI